CRISLFAIASTIDRGTRWVTKSFIDSEATFRFVEASASGSGKFRLSPGRRMLTSKSPNRRETSDAETNQAMPLAPMRPTIFGSPMCATPITSVENTRGAMIIFISRKNISVISEMYSEMLFATAGSGAKTVPEFVDYVKAQPGKLIIASPGTGSGPHLAELLFLQMAAIQMTHAPYRGAAPAFTDLIPGRVHCYFGSGELLTYSRSGQVRVLASTVAKRSPAAPDVPTIAESGVPGYVVDSWQGVFAPAKTPNEIVQKISRDLAKALAEPSLVEKLGRNAYTVGSSSPDGLANILKTDTQKWEAVIKTTGIKID